MARWRGRAVPIALPLRNPLPCPLNVPLLPDAPRPRRPPDERGARQLWPVDTNLMKQVVAGVGTQLQFNFQAAVIVWALVVAVAWGLLPYFVDDALFILGTRRAKTARQNCILVAWSFETQHRLMWTKVDFMIVLYITTFLLCQLYPQGLRCAHPEHATHGRHRKRRGAAERAD